jgi:hypothetical protein
METPRPGTSVEQQPSSPVEPERRFATPTGEPCPHQIRLDGTIEGPGDCYSCGYCLSVEAAAWPC